MSLAIATLHETPDQVVGGGGLAIKDAYALGELLAYRDRAFVLNAYRAILRRDPEPSGLEHHLSRLRLGASTKVDLLSDLRWSPEGLARGVHVDGLLLPTLLQRWKRKRLVGPVISWVHALLRLPALADRIARVEAGAAHDNTMLVDRFDCRAGALDRLLQQALDRVRGLEEQRSAMVHSDEARERRIQALQSALETCGHETEQANGRLSARVDELGFGLTACAESIERIALEHGRALEHLDARLPVEDADKSELDALYVAFEERFRGSAALIRDRVRPYLDDVREAGVGTHATPIIDLGSGNGEWIGVLRDNEFVARGIDCNEVFAALCRGRGLDVQSADAVEALATLPDGSVGGVTALHLVEHLPFSELIRLLDEAMRVLCRGGLLILETPNPENLLVAAHYFYTDPTHRNPIPPETLQWIVEARGFQRVQVRRLTEAREIPAVPGVPDASPGSEVINVLGSRLAIAPDYAVIARKL